MGRNKFIIVAFFSLFIGVSGCTHYLDNKSGNIKILDGQMQYSKLYNELYFKSRYKATRDTEVNKPISYNIRLPKGIVDYDIGPLNNNVFKYKDEQFIFIIQDYDARYPTIDSVITPSGDDLETLINQSVNHDYRKLFNLEPIAIKDDKKTEIIVKGNMLFVLYNVKKQNFSRYKDLMASFKKESD